MDGDSGTWNGHDSHDEDVDWDDLDDEELLAVDVDGVASAGTVTDAECIAPKCTEEQEDSLKARLVINPNKAGTQYVDKDRVAEIVYEASKDSRFFLAEQKRDAIVTARVNLLKHKADGIRRLDLTREKSVVENVVTGFMEEWENLERRWIVCTDMDAFFASVEELDRPELKTRPMAVGGMGMLTTANYEARKYGVRSAMPGYIAKKLCPELILVKPNFEKYTAMSARVREVFALYDANFSPASLDEGKALLILVLVTHLTVLHEAYLDITNYVAAHPEQTTEDVVKEMREEIFRRTGLTASAGIAPNKMLAKVCSDFNKPNGQYFLPPDSVPSFMSALPIRKVPGIGRVTERVLQGLGVEFCGDLRPQLVILYKLFSPIMFNFLVRVSLGIGSVEIDSEWERKSIGCERTFAVISTREGMLKKLDELVGILSSDIEKETVKGRTLTLKLKTPEFESFTRAKTVSRFLSTANDLRPVARGLLERELQLRPRLRVRLMGLSLGKLVKVKDRDEDEGVLERFLKRGRDAGDEEQGEGKKKKVEFVCPVCGECIVCREGEGDVHVGRCLDGVSKGDEREEKEVRKIDEMVTSPSTGGGGILDWVTKRPSSSSSSTAAVQPDSDADVRCPVCGDAFEDPGDLGRVNRHVDACLGRSDMNEAREEGSKGKDVKEKEKEREKDKGIKRFLVVE